MASSPLIPLLHRRRGKPQPIPFIGRLWSLLVLPKYRDVPKQHFESFVGNFVANFVGLCRE
jgi:hypothetical protein